jgi:hypothetical protein
MLSFPEEEPMIHSDKGSRSNEQENAVNTKSTTVTILTDNFAFMILEI